MIALREESSNVQLVFMWQTRPEDSRLARPTSLCSGHGQLESQGSVDALVWFTGAETLAEFEKAPWPVLVEGKTIKLLLPSAAKF